MRSSSSLLGRILLWIALQARNLNDNLKENLENNLYSSFATEGID